MGNEPKNIKIVEGDGSELDISPVYDHINNIQQPRKKKEGIVIPTARKKIQIEKKNKAKKDNNK